MKLQQVDYRWSIVWFLSDRSQEIDRRLLGWIRLYRSVFGRELVDVSLQDSIFRYHSLRHHPNWIARYRYREGLCSLCLGGVGATEDGPSAPRLEK
jgi:hypothetical protein